MKFKKGDIVKITERHDNKTLYEYHRHNYFIIDKVHENYYGCLLLKDINVYFLITGYCLKNSLTDFRKEKLKMLKK
jgi:hypothetical protein